MSRIGAVRPVTGRMIRVRSVIETKLPVMKTSPWAKLMSSMIP